MSPADLLRVGVSGLRTRPLRAVLSALGIAIGIAAMLSVVGISASGQAHVQKTLDSLGTNLLTVEGDQLPDTATAMIRRIGPVTLAAAVSKLPDSVHVYRNDHVPAEQTNGIIAYAADLTLPQVTGARIAQGSWLNAATAAYPAVVLGADAARRLGITAPSPAVLLVLGGRSFAVVGVLRPVPLTPELDSAALIGVPAARQYLGSGRHPSKVYLRATDQQVVAVRDVLAATADPVTPYETIVSRPSDALVAKLATEHAFNALLLGLGAVALLVGGIGVANTMLISVLERRAEIGLRRSLGARRGHIRLQFLTESLLLTLLGGAAGTALGTLVIHGYAALQSWPATVPWWAVSAGLAATVCVGGIAGIHPAIRAARLSPTTALAA
ncbi:ABC transporter permease [Hamadaea tsunoensis]|uniref:ABC transporter permease n=1 Tax=Hamadaea tsunoensis TaxID=53368 RepID=UPI0003FDFECE|nr:ABC transporter permease [Hamadaea tsunoensis]